MGIAGVAGLVEEGGTSEEMDSLLIDSGPFTLDTPGYRKGETPCLNWWSHTLAHAIVHTSQTTVEI